MRKETMSAKSLSQNSPCRKYMLPISSQLQAEIRQLERSFGLGNWLHLDPGISMPISIRLNWAGFFLQITTALERSLVEEALESILSATEETHRISQSMGNWRKSIVVV